MSTSHIKNHSFAAHRTAALAVIEAIRKTDANVRALQRRQDLFPAEQDRRIAEARAAGAAEVAKHRAALAAAVAEDRAESRYAEEPPTADEASRRTYYSQQAVAELAGLGNPNEVLAAVKQVVASGDTERAREYVRAASGRANPSALNAIQREVEPPEARMHRSFAAAVDTMEYQLAFFDRYVDQHLERAGYISPETKAGLAPEEPISTRQLSLWVDALPKRTADAFEAHEAYEASTAGVAEALADNPGSQGWDASDASADPQAQPQATSDAGADHSDAGADAGVPA